ncbi:hypothetical protein LTR53_015631 [Teratosphaeriaceae sp. CCFEE 6253]|nr:hypothetical protein LTR53_015631 [Teratosphaeriaceae sp. CCFEE 6253]
MATPEPLATRPPNMEAVMGLSKPDVQAQQPPPPPRSCIACTDTDPEELVKPCRECPTDYCRECILSMFIAATTDSTRMPPRCCNFLQLHTASLLSAEDASAYRKRFEEWITLDKIYCPSPHCSAFIPQRVLPASGSGDAPKEVSLQSVLSDVIGTVWESPSARFFRGDLPLTELPGYSAAVPRHMDLAMVQASVPKYKSMSEMTADMILIVANTRLYNGLDHPMTRTATQLFDFYLAEISVATDKLLLLASAISPSDHFVCPDCHVAICVKCKQIEHSDSPCDTTLQDHEVAMLLQYGYKRCPRCKHAVKKMFGCSHMQCVCGAHWCYYCQRGISECDGGCRGNVEGEDEMGEREDENEDEDDVATSDMSDNEGDRMEVTLIGEATAAKLANDNTLAGPPVASIPAPPVPLPSAPRPRAPSSSPVATRTSAPNTGAPSPAMRLVETHVVNLDAGGDRRWAQTDDDFGEEPEEDGFDQVWSCRHQFMTFEPRIDAYNRGDLSRMECNKCFERVIAERGQPYAGSQDATAQSLIHDPRLNIVIWILRQRDELRAQKAPVECGCCKPGSFGQPMQVGTEFLTSPKRWYYAGSIDKSSLASKSFLALDVKETSASPMAL